MEIPSNGNATRHGGDGVSMAVTIPLVAVRRREGWHLSLTAACEGEDGPFGWSSVVGLGGAERNPPRSQRRLIWLIYR